ncbi:hypothetical protein MPC4_10315 [Methylocella tundrae]|uniref:Transposase n=1 Tax=Methylocella tundrae TaxID=227605 RepID=A0A8B6M0Y2_METTU|nr:hypothetical protein MPC1_3030003 [Methylocella tundrae]VTZ48365.1 hypothetical protein MPC4_10315 [Methylocella tundrae]
MEGSADPAHISTSYVERGSLTMRMHLRRFTRLTNAFSKEVENHAYAVALHMMYYNFARPHFKLRVTPAMAAGVSDRLWEISDIVALVEAQENVGRSETGRQWHEGARTVAGIDFGRALVLVCCDGDPG